MSVKNFKLLKQGFLTLVILVLTAMSANLFADDLPAGEFQVWTAVEGNITYYVNVGDKVKKGDPLFYITTVDTDPALFWAAEHNVIYNKKLYERRKKLVQTRAVSQEELDQHFQALIDAIDDLLTIVSKAQMGFYTAPFDCEITKLLYLQNSGIGDGNPAINIKPTDKNYKFIPPKPDPRLVKLLDKRKELMKKRAEGLNTDEITLGL